MPLLRLNNLIVNTEHIIRADYRTDALAIYVTDGGQRPAAQFAHMPSNHNVITLTGGDARLMWSALTQVAQTVAPIPPGT
jgi:hypothetical protein